MRRFLADALLLALLAAGAGFAYLKTIAHGFSARVQPPAIEVFALRIARELALPSDAKTIQNSVPDSAAVLAEARAHWADHCAGCHANDGSGLNTMGRQMYPPAPDMRAAGTQTMTDGELFYIIENGIRLTGMPAWGGSAHTRQDSWKLVRFIRHLPSLSPAEIKEMESLNPKTPEDLEEEKQEEDFLKGAATPAPAPHHHHHR